MNTDAAFELISQVIDLTPEQSVIVRNALQRAWNEGFDDGWSDGYYNS